MTGVEISVIVTNYGMRGYLSDALESVLHQTSYSSDSVEIVITTNTIEAVPNQLIENGSVRVRVMEGPLSTCLADAIEHSEGRTLCFLEDDDLFTEDKLAFISRVFADNPRMGYLSNNFSVIDEEGTIQPNHRFRRPIRSARQRVGRRCLSPPDILDQLSRLPELGPDFNMSSITVRRSILTPSRLDTLRRTTVGPDSFLFYCALASECDLCIDPRVFTLYRVHPANASLVDSSSAVVSLARLQAWNERFALSAEAIAEGLFSSLSDDDARVRS
ncbi:MAG: glycosyltransferase family A protein, partial [Thermoplasmata archaeon]